MAEYWVKSTADAPADGPLSAVELKRRAAAGELPRDALISTDTVAWHPAGRVRGLFAAAAVTEHAMAASSASSSPADAAPVPPAPRSGLPPAYPGARTVHSTGVFPPAAHVGDGDKAIGLHAPPPQPPPLTATPLPQPRRPASIGYATPGVTGAGHIHPRRTGAFFVIAVLMLVVGLLHAYTFVFSITQRPDDMHFLLMLASCFLWIGLSIAALVLWVLWLGGVHRDMQVLTAGQYTISPAKAAGFLFIPLFNAFWVVFAPTKLAGAVNAQLAMSGQPPVKRAAVTACMVASVLAPFVGLYALTPLMYAVAMRIIQGGFNRLVANQYTM